MPSYNLAVTNTIPPTKHKKSVINAKNTGYVSAAGMGLSIVSGYSKNKTFRKSHKLFAGISLIALLAHIYIIERWHIKHLTNKK